jgi:hypothetical protein
MAILYSKCAAYLLRYGVADAFTKINDTSMESHKYILRKIAKLDTMISDTSLGKSVKLCMDEHGVQDFQNTLQILYTS